MIFYFRKYKIRGHFNIQTSIWFQFIWWFHDFISVAKKCIFIDYLCINNAPHAENIKNVWSFIIHKGSISECKDFTFNVLNSLLQGEFKCHQRQNNECTALLFHEYWTTQFAFQTIPFVISWLLILIVKGSSYLWEAPFFVITTSSLYNIG